MPLMNFWRSTPSEFQHYRLQQIVSMAGNGNLADGNLASNEFREFLQFQTTDTLSTYIKECILNSFPDSGFALQDVINELGRRLDYSVENGRYRGSKGNFGYDGIWIHDIDNWSLIIEVKTTDSYSINLDVVAQYRKALILQNRVNDNSSIMMVVGRQDTGGLEAQIRGSRHAWTIRLISADALIKLVILKESTDDVKVAAQIRDIIRPMEYTRVDNLINIIFSTAEDVSEQSIETTIDDIKEIINKDSESTDDDSDRSYSRDIVAIKTVRDSVIGDFQKQLGEKLLQNTRVKYWNVNKSIRVCCTISKRYTRSNSYWYAYHPHWDDFLKDCPQGFILLGTLDSSSIYFAIPLSVLSNNLDNLYTTNPKNGRKYYHIEIEERDNKKFELKLRSGKGVIDVSGYVKVIT